MEWCHKMRFPVRRVWSRVATRLRIRKSGLPKLRNDIRSCQYDDVHVMWAMLNRNEGSQTIRLGGKNKKRSGFRNLFNWAKCDPLCRGF